MTGAVDGVRAIVFDFNGTLCDDERILYDVYAAMFAELGRPLSQRQYVDQLAGLSDEAIRRRWLGDGGDLDGFVAERVRRYRALADATMIHAGVRRAVRYASARVATAIVSGAAGVEIDGMLRGAGLRDAFRVVVGADRVRHGKPAPEGYELALAELSETVAGLKPGDVIAFEDTEAGIAAAKAAGIRCVAVAGTVPRARLAQADAIVDALDQATVQRLIG